MNHFYSFLRSALLYIGFVCLAMPNAFAQSKYDEARTYLDNKEFTKAADLYEQLYIQGTDNNDIFQDYLFVLMSLKDYKKAEQVAKKRLEQQANNPINYIVLGAVYASGKKEKKATELFTTAISYINGDDLLTQKMANAFSKNGYDDWAIKTYERANEITQNPGLYSTALAKLYDKSGDVEKAISITIESHSAMQQYYGDEGTETQLLELIGKDSEKQKLAQKAIIKLVNAHPEDYFYTYLLTWIFSIQDNWNQALVQIQALEKRSTDKGRLLLDFAANAVKKNQYDPAGKAYRTVLAYGTSNPNYRRANEALLQMQLQQMERSPTLDEVQVVALSEAYDTFFVQYPDALGSPALLQYAAVEAQYANNVPKAISLLQKAISSKQGNKNFIAQCKLQLGDYYIITGDVWEAALVYAQVDKAFREDALGEEARFRNAKLSYYQNDFEQAQAQLSVLKASTSELIANDALFLSVQITENIPPDSNMLPLQRFAEADLLLFQNKDKEAEALLDSVAIAFPKNPLADDILLLRSKIASKHRDYTKAIAFLEQIVTDYGKDVLADDALFRIAEIYQFKLDQNTKAKQYYERLIIDYPGSSFVQRARQSLTDMTEAL